MLINDFALRDLFPKLHFSRVISSNNNNNNNNNNYNNGIWFDIVIINNCSGICNWDGGYFSSHNGIQVILLADCA